MRILLITDSLGCPRKEIDVSDTWTDRLISKWSGNNRIIYTYCMRGLYASDINLVYVTDLSPDVIIIQIGIVDACRRALSKRELSIISHIPLVSKIINWYCNRHHYFLTSIRNIHYCAVSDFSRIIREIQSQTNAKIGFVAIAPPGKYLVDRVFGIKDDVIEYNNSIKSIEGITWIDPYKGIDDIDSIQLNDGHHLNQKGNEIAFLAIDKVLQRLITEDDNHV